MNAGDWAVTFFLLVAFALAQATANILVYGWIW